MEAEHRRTQLVVSEGSVTTSGSLTRNTHELA